MSAPALTLRVGPFEGPFDLLLHLCRTQEIDLARLPVRTITDQYLAHLEAMDFQDLETAGAYLVMAATLIYLKSRLLVPAEDGEEQLDEEADAVRQDLEERLREYARVKAVGAWLAERQAEQALLWGRPSGELPAAEDLPLADLSVHWLQRAMQRLLDEQRRRRPRQVEAEPVSVLERMTEILSVLRDTWSLLFSSLTGNRGRAEVVVTLLAVLELARLGQVRAHQTERFGEIVIERRVPDPAQTVEALRADGT
ncbi:MAG TPA: segregation/condensation protein A [Candidatus Binatia bacterium]|nr:segregation/condensation protein A [Candidatus Binatia bacterium]